MTERKFTDEQIIKALECCKKLDYNFEECKQCPYGGKCYDGDVNFLQDIIDLINRQRAEIERLEAIIDAAEEHFAPLPFKNKFDEYIEKAKSEAIKEFAERLKKRLERKYTTYGREYVLRHLRELVKEMTEGSKNELS